MKRQHHNNRMKPSFQKNSILIVLLCALVTAKGQEQGQRGQQEQNTSTRKKKIAIIGGGIGGTFAAKYLSDYDTNCSLDSITIYEPFSILDAERGDITDTSTSTSTTTADSTSVDVIPVPMGEVVTQQQQGPRVSSITLKDGTTVELGASIIFNENKLALEMLENDDMLEKIEPLSSTRPVPTENENDDNEDDNDKLNDGMGIYNGHNGNGNNNNNNNAGSSIWPLMTSKMTKEETTSAIVWRYNLDIYKISKITDKALQSFKTIYDDLLQSTSISSFDHISSPNDIWKYVGLDYTASVSLDTLLDDIGVSKDSVSWWKNLFLGYFFGAEQGLVRDELFTAMNVCNNNKNNAQMTGLAGLVNFVASGGELFAVKGGNHKLVQSAYKQAKSNYATNPTCSTKNDKQNESNNNNSNNDNDKITHIPKRIKSIVSHFEKTQGMELFDPDGKNLGSYDIVILASPLQFAGINFLTKGSLFDKNVLHPMSLNGMVDGDATDSNANDHGHESALKGGHLPDSTVRPYTQVVTTVVSNAKLNKSYFFIDSDIPTPKALLFTEKGKQETGISSIGRIASDIFKVFSSNELSMETISSIFGNDAHVEYVKVWGDKNGGATPDFNGGGDSSYATQFLLYEGGHGENSFDDDSSALYYVNSMESAVSAIEISAIGAKVVSKLVARRLQLLQPTNDSKGEEL